VNVEEIQSRMLLNPGNSRIVRWVCEAHAPQLIPWVPDGRNQGGMALLERWAADLPRACKWSLHTSDVLIHPDTGLIFAVALGRFTHLLRHELPADDVPNPDAERRYETLDSWINLSSLDREWSLLRHWVEEDEEPEGLARAYQFAGRR
jgi:hypothetical protein